MYYTDYHFFQLQKEMYDAKKVKLPLPPHLNSVITYPAKHNTAAN